MLMLLILPTELAVGFVEATYSPTILHRPASQYVPQHLLRSLGIPILSDVWQHATTTLMHFQTAVVNVWLLAQALPLIYMLMMQHKRASCLLPAPTEGSARVCPENVLISALLQIVLSEEATHTPTQTTENALLLALHLVMLIL